LARASLVNHYRLIESHAYARYQLHTLLW